MSDELRRSDEVAAWLAAGLLLRRVVAADDDDVISRAIVACANELPALPPPGMIADVAALLGGTRLPLFEPIAGEQSLRVAIRAYEDDVLARLVGSARYDDVVAAYAHVTAGERATATALVVGAICERARFAGTPVSPPALRRALARPRSEREAAGRSELAGGALTERLAEAYHELARSARHAHSLVDDRDVFALDHLAVLRDLGGRMTADHIGAAAEELLRSLPRRLPAKRLQRGVSDTKLADENLYPAGGFTAITPQGSNASLENLVTSELVYMEDGAEPDVFTLRYVEGELLYYTRDDSEFRRHRHLVTFVLGKDLDDARVKDRELTWQRLVLALGLVLAAIRWLTDQLGDQALALHVAFPSRLLEEEREILALLLEAEISRGIVTVVEQPAADAIGAAAALARNAIVDVVTLSLGDAPAIPKGLRAIHVDLRGAAPALANAAPAEAGGDAWNEWCEVAEDLLRWLV